MKPLILQYKSQNRNWETMGALRSSCVAVWNHGWFRRVAVCLVYLLWRGGYTVLENLHKDKTVEQCFLGLLMTN